MSSSQPLEGIEVSKAHQAVLPTPADEKHLEMIDHKSAVSDGDDHDHEIPDGYSEPTDEELNTLRRVPGEPGSLKAIDARDPLTVSAVFA